MVNKARIVKQKKMLARALQKKSDLGGKKGLKARQDLTEKRFKFKAKDKWKTRAFNRCEITGRPRGFMRDFGVSRCVFRELAEKAQIPGVRKASW
jgi:small subunit ribosomal protein S14